MDHNKNQEAVLAIAGKLRLSLFIRKAYVLSLFKNITTGLKIPR